jgi:polar amino acid transport system substrate-binding protein
MKNILTYLLISLFIISPVFSKEEKTIKLATIEWPPYVTAKVKSKGWTSEVIKAAFKTQGYKAIFSFIKGGRPWGQVLSMVKSGKFVAGFPAYYSEDRTESFYFSRSIGRGPLGFFKRKGEKINFDGDLSSLKSFKIGIVKDYVNSEHFERATYLKTKSYKDDKTSLVMLNKKRVDLVLLDKLVTKYHLKNDPYLKKFDFNIEFIEPPLENKNLHIIFTKKKNMSPQLMRIFQKGLNEIKSNGVYDKIVKQNGSK